MGLFFNKKKQNANNQPSSVSFQANDGANYTVSYDPPEQHARIIVDSMNLINKTLNPDTYFSRYKLASSKACHISEYKGIVYGGMTAKEIYEMLRDDKDQLHREFIDRLFEQGREDNLVYQMYEVGLYMSPQTRAYFVERLNRRTYHFCKIRFNENSNKLYTYVTKDKSVTIGDTVTIPTGNSFVPDSKVMQVVEVYDDCLDNLTFPIESLRCVERKLKSIVCPHCNASIEVNTGTKIGKCTHCGAEFYFV